MNQNQRSLLPEISLRRLRGATDGDLTFAWRNNPEIYKWCRQVDVLHPEPHKRWYDNQQLDPTVSMYMIEASVGIDFNSREKIIPVGVCGLTGIDLINRRAEFSLYIAPDSQGCGFGEMALRALVAKGFKAYGLNCIWGEAFDGNPAIKMFNRVGFKEEGKRREFYFRDGKFVDAVLFSLLRSEYVG